MVNQLFAVFQYQHAYQVKAVNELLNSDSNKTGFFFLKGGGLVIYIEKLNRTIRPDIVGFTLECELSENNCSLYLCKAV